MRGVQRDRYEACDARRAMRGMRRGVARRARRTYPRIGPMRKVLMAAWLRCEVLLRLEKTFVLRDLSCKM